MGYLGHLIKLMRAFQILLHVCVCISLHTWDHAHMYFFFYSSPKFFLVVIAQGHSAVLGQCRQTAAEVVQLTSPGLQGEKLISESETGQGWSRESSLRGAVLQEVTLRCPLVVNVLLAGVSQKQGAFRHFLLCYSRLSSVLEEPSCFEKVA